LEDGLRLAIMRLLSERPTLSQRQLARELGMSLGKTNYCLRALIEKGWVKMGNFRSSAKKSDYAYALTTAGLRAKASATLRFLHRKQAEYVAIEAEIARLRAELAVTPSALTPSALTPSAVKVGDQRAPSARRSGSLP